jgi:hypothetical protein
LLHEALTLTRETGAGGTVLFCLLAECDRRLTRGDVGRGLELLRQVRSQPGLTRDNEHEIRRVLARAALDRAALDFGPSTGEHVDILTIVNEIISELADGPPSPVTPAAEGRP